jgi:hypothetical protein
MSEINLNWKLAKVKDAELTVDLDGKASSEWKHSFEDTVRLLGGGDWGRVRIKKGSVHVEAVVPGEEDKLRFFLESVVEQANAAQRASEPEDEQQVEDENGASGVDAEMAERFRSYSAAEEQPSD